MPEMVKKAWGPYETGAALGATGGGLLGYAAAPLIWSKPSVLRRLLFSLVTAGMGGVGGAALMNWMQPRKPSSLETAGKTALGAPRTLVEGASGSYPSKYEYEKLTPVQKALLGGPNTGNSAANIASWMVRQTKKGLPIGANMGLPNTLTTLLANYIGWKKGAQLAAKIGVNKQLKKQLMEELQAADRLGRFKDLSQQKLFQDSMRQLRRTHIAELPKLKTVLAGISRLQKSKSPMQFYRRLKNVSSRITPFESAEEAITDIARNINLNLQDSKNAILPEKTVFKIKSKPLAGYSRLGRFGARLTGPAAAILAGIAVNSLPIFNSNADYNAWIQKMKKQ